MFSAQSLLVGNGTSVKCLRKSREPITALNVVCNASHGSKFLAMHSLKKMLIYAHCHCKGFVKREFKAWDVCEAQTLIHKYFLAPWNMEVYSRESPALASRSLPNLLAIVSVNKPRNTTTPFFHVLNIKMQISEICVHNFVRRQVNFVCTRLINFNFVGKLINFSVGELTSGQVNLLQSIPWYYLWFTSFWGEKVAKLKEAHNSFQVF